MRTWFRTILLVFAAVQTVAAQGGAFPARLETYLTNVVRISGEQRQALLRGQPVTQLLDGDDSKEVAIFGAVWVDAPMRRYVDAVSDIESFEKGGGFRITKRISTPPRPEDFAAMRLPDEDIDDLKDCRVGDCEIKLGEAALKRFRSEIDWNAPTAPAAANALMRQIALEYVTRYLEGGNDQLAVYRDRSRPRFVAQEFRTMIAQMPELTVYMPNLRRYLLDFPKVESPQMTSFIYWQETDFGLKPTLRISHLSIREGAEDTVVASKMLYASHYFWTGVELRVLIPDQSRGQGFWFVTVNRSRSDGLSGFTGMFVRGRVRSQVQEGTANALRSIKQRLEAVR